jgi:leucyl-tRNA synthetase
MSFSHNEIEKKWQDVWERAQCFKAFESHDKPKYYALDMFPYPSGAGLHVGHLASYTPTDIVARYKRAKGFNVLHPMGYDAFGLPAEQYAIQTGIHPAETTRKAIQNFRRQLQDYGMSFDWSRELSTCEPEFYRWTQFIFLKLFERGLAYQKEVPVNWCPALKTVLANEEVVDGKSERGGHPVIRKPMKQWMLNITSYAERLLKDLDRLDWPERTKDGQRNWIGKSFGANIQFHIADASQTVEVFTTRPDTLFGATFLVLAPEHPLVRQITRASAKPSVDEYVQKTAARSEVDRKASTVKTGVFTGAFALHPFSGAKLPIWIADYVLMEYGTGAIMAVPGHDDRDFEFASDFHLPIVRVVESTEPLPFMGEGRMTHSDFLNGLAKTEAIETMIQRLEQKGLGQRKVQYKLRDWLFSRQRYWGEPFPIYHVPGLPPQTVGENELPITLPEVADYEPTEQGEPPLARVPAFVNYTDPRSGREGRRDTDTMPGSAGSSWYFLRYTDPHNSKAPFSREAQNYWMPVDLYVGGAEHTVGHLLYARFWQKVLFDAGLVTHDEPFLKLAHQGTVLGPDGQRMSKSRGNVVNPDEVRSQYGADATRLYICFLGPFDKDKPWSSAGIDGVRRFLDRIWRLCVGDDDTLIAEEISALPPELEKVLHKTIKKVGEDIEALNFNTAISAMMILVNDLYRLGLKPKPVLKTLCQLLMPFAPHVAEELWARLGGQGLVSVAPWPQYVEAFTVDEEIDMGVQVNGKMRGTIRIGVNSPEADAVAMALQLPAVQSAVGGQLIGKVIYKPGRILNLIVK